jgi:signal transduction histidine kinase
MPAHATPSSDVGPPPSGGDADACMAQVRILYRQAPIAVAASVMNSGLVALALAPSVGGLRTAGWFALHVMQAAMTLAVWDRHRRRPSGAADRRWAQLASLASASSGLLWGLGSAILFPEDPFARAFLAFVIGGMSAGALAAFSAHLPTFLAYLLSATLPLALRFLLEGTGISVAMAVMIGVFAAALTLVGRNVNRALREEFAARAELARRTAELTEANLRLGREIKGRQATEERLLQAQKLEAVGQLTGGIAHDFNNLLTTVMGNLELALPLAPSDTKLARLLRRAFAGAQRGAALTKHLLAFARKQRLNPTSIDLAVVAEDFAALAQQTLGPAVRLCIHKSPDLWRAQADRGQLELALLNLAINARDAMPEGGELRIVLANCPAGEERPAELLPGDYVIVRVSDTGTGMDAATLAHAFEPFFTTKEVGRGSGLGLAMVQGFAVQSGGSVRIESAPGKGTEVSLWLPRATQEAANEVPSNAAPPRSTDGIRILVCEDDPDLLSFVAETLRDAGYSVREAETPVAALRLLKQDKPGLLLSDYAMPGMNGAAFIAEARRLQPGIKVLLMSGHADALTGKGAPDVPLLPKPFAPAALTRRVADILAAT